MTLARKYFVNFILLWLIGIYSLGTGETEAVYSVNVIIQSVTANYGDTMVAIPVYLDNEGFDTIAGYSLFITSGFPDLIDFVDVVDTAGTLSSGFCTFTSYIETGNEGDTIPSGDQITIVAHNLSSDTLNPCNSPNYIYPQTFGELLFVLHVNVADSCDFISDSSNVFISVFSGISNISTNRGKSIPTPGETSAESLYYLEGFIDVPGTLIMGDVNGSCKGRASCKPTSADIVYLVNYIFDKDRPATGCVDPDPGTCWNLCPEQAANVNCISGITSADIVYLVNYIFDKDRPATGCVDPDPGSCWTPVPCP